MCNLKNFIMKYCVNSTDKTLVDIPSSLLDNFYNLLKEHDESLFRDCVYNVYYEDSVENSMINVFLGVNSSDIFLLTNKIIRRKLKQTVWLSI